MLEKEEEKKRNNTVNKRVTMKCGRRKVERIQLSSW